MIKHDIIGSRTSAGGLKALGAIVIGLSAAEPHAHKLALIESV